MGRIILAEECLSNYLLSLENEDCYTIGLILGQSTELKDFVVHLVRTPPPASKDVIEEGLIGPTTSTQQEPPDGKVKSLSDVPSSWVADHARHVTRMLPGGMWVLGIFVVGPTDCLMQIDSTQKLRSIASAIHKNLEADRHLYGNNPHESLVLAFNSSTKKFVCKSFGTNGLGSLKNADCTFQSKVTKWFQLETRVDFDEVYAVKDKRGSESLKKQLQNILDDTFKKINSAIIAIEGEPRSPSELIEVTDNEKKREMKESKNNELNSSSNALQAAIYVPCPLKSRPELKEVDCSATMRLVGQLVSRTFVHQKATVKEATNAIIQDVMRSLASRLEMHWDSLLEEENCLPEDNVTLHEPPRRVLVALPQSRITLSDYLFPGEGPQEALISLQELLDLHVQESSIQKEFELQVDPSEFYCQNELKSEPTEHGKYQENLQYLFYTSGFFVAIIILFAAILVHLY